jgi:hypothetical protein
MVREMSLHLHISSPDFKAQETGQPIEEEQSFYVVNETGLVESLFKLWGSESDISVRAEADGALRALSSRLDTAKRSLMNANGFPVFISTIQVPSKEFSYGVVAKKFK